MKEVIRLGLVGIITLILLFIASLSYFQDYTLKATSGSTILRRPVQVSLPAPPPVICKNTDCPEDAACVENVCKKLDLKSVYLQLQDVKTQIAIPVKDVPHAANADHAIKADTAGLCSIAGFQPLNAKREVVRTFGKTTCGQGQTVVQAFSGVEPGSNPSAGTDKPVGTILLDGQWRDYYTVYCCSENPTIPLHINANLGFFKPSEPGHFFSRWYLYLFPNKAIDSCTIKYTSSYELPAGTIRQSKITDTANNREYYLLSLAADDMEFLKLFNGIPRGELINPVVRIACKDLEGKTGEEDITLAHRFYVPINIL
ncbi:hypothetical protein HZB00_00195 [Candidatus Woesearchaeota archaeon]|nr:hypothetical protein [Candidatus Woesearchaeota archaeon]